MRFPTSVAYDPVNNILFQTDIINNVVYYTSPVRGSGIIAGNGTTGSGGDGKQGVLAQLDCPINIVYNNGKLYIADYNNKKIRVIDLGSRVHNFQTTTRLPQALLTQGTIVQTTMTNPFTTNTILALTPSSKQLTCKDKPLCFVKAPPKLSIEPNIVSNFLSTTIISS